MNPRQLNALLKAWAARQQPDEERQRTLEADIMRALHAAKAPRWGELSPPFERTLCMHPWAYAMAAGVLLIVMGVYGLRFLKRGDQAPASWAAVRPSEVAGAQILFEETAALFRGRLRWIGQTPASVHLEVAPDPTPAAIEAPPVMIRLVATKRLGPKGNWTPVWEADVLAPAQAWVDFHLGPGRMDQVRLWAHRNRDGTYAIESGIRLLSAASFSLETAAVLRPGQARELARYRADGAEYRLYQTVTTLGG